MNAITKTSTITLVLMLNMLTAIAQQQKLKPEKSTNSSNFKMEIPISKAELGDFPYFKTLQHYYPRNNSDSIVFSNNRTYFYDGKNLFTIDGKVLSGTFSYNYGIEKLSVFGCIQEFDKVIETLGGKKVYTGKMPEEQLKALAGEDLSTLGSRGQVVHHAYKGIIEYVIKTADKEVWVQLVPYDLDDNYSLLVIEKDVPLLTINTTKENELIDDLEKNKKGVMHFSFEPDNENLETESKDELLSLVAVYQKHPDWILNLDCYSASIGKAEYTLTLTEKRARAIKQELLNLGVKSNAVIAKGWGDQKPVAPNDTEQGKFANTRIEISLQ